MTDRYYLWKKNSWGHQAYMTVRTRIRELKQEIKEFRDKHGQWAAHYSWWNATHDRLYENQRYLNILTKGLSKEFEPELMQ